MNVSGASSSAPSSPPVEVALGTARVGSRTLASTRDASFVYDLVGTGLPSQREVVPSSPRAIALAQTASGAQMVHAIQRFASQADPEGGASDLHSIVIAPDVDAITGINYVNDDAIDLSAKTTPAQLDTLEKDVAEWRTSIKAMDGVNGGFTDKGVTYLMPDESRALLASVGAYHPAADEPAHNAAPYHAFMPKLMRHEVEHTVTPPTDAEYASPLGGIEEGIAETLAQSQPSLAADRHDLPGLAEYGATTSASKATTDGWRAHIPPPSNSDSGSKSNARYASRQHIVGDLLRLAGIDHNTREGYAQSRDILQGTNLTYVPGNLARAMIAQHDVDPAKYEAIRTYIRDITESKSDNPIAGLRQLLGLPANH